MQTRSKTRIKKSVRPETKSPKSPRKKKRSKTSRKPSKNRKRRRSSTEVVEPLAGGDHEREVIETLHGMGYTTAQIVAARGAGHRELMAVVDFLATQQTDEPPKKRRRVDGPGSHDSDSDLEILAGQLDNSVIFVNEIKNGGVHEDDHDVKMMEVERPQNPQEEKFEEAKRDYQQFVDENERALANIDVQLAEAHKKREEVQILFDAGDSRKIDIESEEISLEQLRVIIRWYRDNTAQQLPKWAEKCSSLEKERTRILVFSAQRDAQFAEEEDNFRSMQLALELMAEEQKGGGKIDLYSRNVQYLLSNAKAIPDECDCPICFTPAPLKESIILPCTHSFCVDCMRTMMRIKIEEREVTHLVCPQDECDQAITHEDVRLIVDDEKMFGLFDEYLTEKTLQAAADCKFCPAPDCGTPMFGDKDSPMMRCPKCSKQFCFNCLTEEWHEGVSCEAFQQWKRENGEGDAKFGEWANQNTKKCPKCSSPIEKNGGCNHMTCRSCKHEFHWETLEEWKGYNHRYRGNATIYPGQPRNHEFARAMANAAQMNARFGFGMPPARLVTYPGLPHALVRGRPGFQIQELDFY